MAMAWRFLPGVLAFRRRDEQSHPVEDRKQDYFEEGVSVTFEQAVRKVLGCFVVWYLIHTMHYKAAYSSGQSCMMDIGSIYKLSRVVSAVSSFIIQ